MDRKRIGRARAPLVPIENRRALRVPGRGKGKWRVGRSFDAPLPEKILQAFEGSGERLRGT